MSKFKIGDIVRRENGKPLDVNNNILQAEIIEIHPENICNIGLKGVFLVDTTELNNHKESWLVLASRPNNKPK